MKLSVSATGLSKAIELVTNLDKEISLKCDELATRLGQLGVRIATMYYDSAEYAGNSDVKVTLDETGKLGTVKIVATGYAVLFIEFGTGITKEDATDARAELKSGKVVGHGEFGNRHGADPDGWYYPATKGLGPHPPDDSQYADKNQTFIHTFGNDATPAMYWTRRDLIQNIENIAREVFKL